MAPINAEVNIGNQSSVATGSVFSPVHFMADQYLTLFQNSIVFIRLISSIMLTNDSLSRSNLLLYFLKLNSLLEQAGKWGQVLKYKFSSALFISLLLVFLMRYGF
jgi:hypothetical protein